jgi:hypothetical protein
MVEMLPKPNMIKNLAELLVEMNKLDRNLAEALFKIKIENKPNEAEIFDVSKMNKEAIRTTNVYEMNLKQDELEKKMNQANYLLSQAEDLDHQAYLKREQAYAIVPSLNPRNAHITESLNDKATNTENSNDYWSNVSSTKASDEQFVPNPVTGLTPNELQKINTVTPVKDSKQLTPMQIADLMNKNNNPTIPTAKVDYQPNDKMINALADMFEGKITKEQLNAISQANPSRMDVASQNQGTGI